MLLNSLLGCSFQSGLVSQVGTAFCQGKTLRALLAYQRTQRLALTEGSTDLANKATLERAAQQTIEEHRAAVTELNETRRIRALLAMPLPADQTDYLEKLAYN